MNRMIAKYRFKALALGALISLSLYSCSNKDELGDDASKSFTKYYGNTDSDEGFDIKQTSDGGYAIFGTKTNAGTGSDLALIKTDEYGNLQWEQFYGGNLDDIGRSFDILPSGGFVMVGTFSNNTNTSDPTANAYDALVVWANENGEFVDSVHFGFNGDNPRPSPGAPKARTNEELFSVVADKVNSSNQVFVVGYSTAERTNAVVGNETQSNVLGNKDILFARVEPNGVLHKEAFGYEENDQGFDCIQIPAGSYNAPISEGDFYFTGYVEFQDPNSNQFNQRVFLGWHAKFGTDVFSALGWRQSNGLNATFNEGRSIYMVDNNELYISGWSGGSNNSVIFLLSGSVNDYENDNVSVTPFGQNGFNRGFGMDYVGDGSLVISGNTAVANLVQGGTDHYLIKINNQGSLDWEKTYGGSGDETSNAVIVSNDGGYALIGVSDFESNALIHFIKTDSKGIVGN